MPHNLPAMHFLALVGPETAAGAVIYILLFLFILALAIAWIIFPFIVISKCNEIARVLAAIRDKLCESNDAANAKFQQAGLEETVRARQMLEKIHNDNAERNKALQWIIDNWNSRQR